MTTSTGNAGTAVVLDFETTGLSPRQGDRAIEIGAVKLVDGRIVDRFQSLMNPGRSIPTFIQQLTGISNAMIASAPPCRQAMSAFVAFADGLPLVAHNAAFDMRFLEAELGLIGLPPCGPSACSLLVARRLYLDAPDHKLATLVRYKGLPNDGTYHRALADAEMTAHLWTTMLDDIRIDHRCDEPSFALMQDYGKRPKHSASIWLAKQLATCQMRSA